MTGYAQYALGYFERGWMPIPLPHGKKSSPPDGTTGRTAGPVFAPQIRAWAEQNPDANVGLRLAKNVIGIDVDAYKPNARATMARLEALAPMPTTWRSSSRTDGVSGIYFFRLPGGVDESELRDPRGADGGKDSDVEVIRHSHRYAVVAPSLHPEGGHYRWYAPDGSASAPKIGQLPELPAEWLAELLGKKAAAPTTAPVAQQQQITDAGRATAGSYEQKAVQGCIDRLRAMSAAAVADPGAYRGEPWDQTTYDVACRLIEIANADWSELQVGDVSFILFNEAPRDAGFDDDRVIAKLESATRKVGGQAAAPPKGRSTVDDSGLFKGAPSAAVDAPSGRRVIAHDSQVDVSNHAEAAQWLFDEVGTGKLSGVFYRKGDVVYTPRIGEEGYVEPRSAVAEGAASITVMADKHLQARIQHRYEVTKLVVDKSATKTAKAIDPQADDVLSPKPAVFPLEAARIVVSAADDAPNLRTLNGVTHSPMFRSDGSLISQPGYDAQTGTLFLPTGGQPNYVPEEPSASDVEMAVKMVSYMLQDFSFVTEHDRATYIGLMMTPLLRGLVPPPYKLGVIEAHQPGSGKTFLARALATIHGGVLHAELPKDEAEIVKTISAILDTQTSPIVAFDNVTGMVRSPSLTGLLTSPTFQGRRLGTGALIDADNDRLWIITGNNAVLGGDLGRRHVRVRIDPGVPNPEERTGFAITNFEAWVHEHRGELLWSLLVLIRHWVVSGMPLVSEPTGDSYGRWIAVLRGVLATAGMPGTFDLPETRDSGDPDEEDWGHFAELIWELMQDRQWTARSLLGLVQHPSLPDDPNKPIPFEALPPSLYNGKQHVDPVSLAASFGYFLRNRRGKYLGRSNLSFQISPQRTKAGKQFYLKRYSSI